MMIQGIAPGPQVMTERPQLFWGMIVSMWVGNLMLVVLNLPLIGIWIRLLQVPYRLLFPSILVFMAIGVYSVANNPFDLVIMAVFGLFGLACMKLGMEPAPLALGVVLGPLMEENLRRAMLLSRGDPTVFLTRPISAGFIIASVLMLVLLSLPALRRKRAQVFAEEAPGPAEPEKALQRSA
jgi:TctA family transporter